MNKERGNLKPSEMKLCLHREETDMSFSLRRLHFTNLLVQHFIFFFTFDLPFSDSSRHCKCKPCGVSFRSRIAGIPSGEFKQLLESATRLASKLVGWLGKRLWVSPQCWKTKDSSSSGFFGYPKKIS